MFLIVVLVKRQVLHAKLRPGLRLMECYGWVLLLITLLFPHHPITSLQFGFTLLFNVYSWQVFHLGTIAFGSLIIAIIRMIRTILEYVEKKCKKFNNDLTR